MKVVTAKCI